ncbi:MAG: hypothetical protein WD314_14955 [Trueperaceae bacterium]
MTTESITAPSPDGRFDLPTVLREARGLIKGSKRTVFVLGLLGVLVHLGLAAIESYTTPDGRAGTGPDLVWLTVSSLIVLPVTIAVTAVALRRAAGRPVSDRILLEYIGHYPGFAVIALLPVLFLSIAGQLPTILVVIVLIVLGSMFGFAGYYMLDRDLSPFAAMRASLQLFFVNFRRLLLFWLVSAVLTIVSLLTLGIGFIWVAPFLTIAHGLMYAHAAGLQRFAPEERPA